VASAEHIENVPEDEMLPLRDKLASVIETGFSGNDVDRKRALSKLIYYVSDEAMMRLIPVGLASGDKEIGRECAYLIDEELPENEQPLLRHKVAEFVEKGLDSGEVDLEETCAGLIRLVSNEKKPELWDKVEELLEEGISSGNTEIAVKRVNMLGDLPPDRKAKIINSALSSGNTEMEIEYGHWVGDDIPEQEKNILKKKLASRIREGLERGDEEGKKRFLGLIWDMIWDLPTDQLRDIIMIGFESGDWRVTCACVEMMVFIPKKEATQIKKKAASSIYQKLSSGDEREVNAGRWSIWCAAKKERKRMFEKVRRLLGISIAEPPLYKGKEISGEHLSRDEFEKTGSKTILLGGELKDKTIVRKMQPEAFLVWQKLYEDHEMWSAAGFDYVPIEPIQSFKFNKEEGMVDVYSGVLDVSFAEWSMMSGYYVSELEKKRNAILKVLGKNKIDHGHAHNGNFCLRFFRDEKGEIDLDTKPRIYLIDFDQASPFTKKWWEE
jgi:hypothetical protein